MKLFILDYGKTTIEGNSSSIEKSEVVFEHPINNQIRSTLQEAFDVYENTHLRSILPEYRKAKKINNEEQIKHYSRQLDSLAKDMRKKIYALVEENSNQHGIAQVVAEELIPREYLKTEEFTEVFNLYNSDIRNSYYGKQLKDFIDEENNPAIELGESVYEFEMQNTEGNYVSFTDFRGKHVLLDFWASWCGPCREENPNLKKAYQKYHPKGFEIVGISLDNNRDAWLKAIEKDKLIWTNLSDLKGWENSLAVHYNVNSVPANMLIDPNGIIIAMDLRGQNLLEKLDGIYKK